MIMNNNNNNDNNNNNEINSNNNTIQQMLDVPQLSSHMRETISHLPTSTCPSHAKFNTSLTCQHQDCAAMCSMHCLPGWLNETQS